MIPDRLLHRPRLQGRLPQSKCPRAKQECPVAEEGNGHSRLSLPGLRTFDNIKGAFRAPCTVGGRCWVQSITSFPRRARLTVTPAGRLVKTEKHERIWRNVADAFFLCAGSARPQFWVEQTEELMKADMNATYGAQAYTALASGVKGDAYFSIVGYSTYCPGKFALRGLAEALHSEFKLYDIDVHISFPGTIYTPGYEQENKTKPKITLKIEESDGGATQRVQQGKFHITGDFIGNVFRASSAGSSPRNSYIADLLYGLVGYIALPIWRNSVDDTVRAHRREHQEYLQQKGLLGRA
ncbi:hypothetical protein NUW54_g2813 [Trametes sanguinea]|uniref:Uncharacterized protein n=1 Tax=Trametes sanguinea TaxID=158606 RepID=A0ACC1Q3V1_9APHY|nr:hypothetical protein NUW54_g2813 [Trametes sanguinea]